MLHSLLTLLQQNKLPGKKHEVKTYFAKIKDSILFFFFIPELENTKIRIQRTLPVGIMIPSAGLGVAVS